MLDLKYHGNCCVRIGLRELSRKNGSSKILLRFPSIVTDHAKQGGCLASRSSTMIVCHLAWFRIVHGIRTTNYSRNFLATSWWKLKRYIYVLVKSVFTNSSIIITRDVKIRESKRYRKDCKKCSFVSSGKMSLNH